MTLSFSNELNYTGYSRFIDQRRLSTPMQLPSSMSYLNLRASSTLPPSESKKFSSARSRNSLSNSDLFNSRQSRSSLNKSKDLSISKRNSLQLSPMNDSKSSNESKERSPLLNNSLNSLDSPSQNSFNHSFISTDENAIFASPLKESNQKEEKSFSTTQSWTYSSLNDSQIRNLEYSPRNKSNISKKRYSLPINYNKSTSISTHLHPNSPLESYIEPLSARKINALKIQENAMRKRKLAREKTEYKEISVLFPVPIMSVKNGRIKKPIKKPNFLNMSGSLNMQLNSIYRS